MENDVIIDILNNLVESCKDGEYGFFRCAEVARDRSLAWFFTYCAEESAAAAADLQRMVVQTGGTAEIDDAASAATHRGWVPARDELVGRTDLALLEECERGGCTALERYRDALEEPLPALIRETIRRQCESADRNQARVQALIDEARSMAQA